MFNTLHKSMGSLRSYKKMCNLKKSWRQSSSAKRI